MSLFSASMRPYEQAAAEARSLNNEHMISRLANHNEFLQRRTMDLEAQLESTIAGEASSRRQAADTAYQNVSLSEKLRDMDMMTERLQLDKETVVEVSVNDHL